LNKEKITIGFYLDISQYVTDIDLSNPMSGNPGIGGTQYEIILLAHTLANTFSNLKVVIFSNNRCQLHNKNIKLILTKSYDDLILFSNNYMVDYLVLTNMDINENVCELLDAYNVKAISWTHVYIDYRQANLIYNTKNILRNIFVSNQQYDYYFDHPIINKSIVIFNGIPIFNQMYNKQDSRTKNIITYMSGLYYSKYFHIFAKYWNRIHKKIPSSILNVIGSGNLYNHTAPLGPLGVASSDYEHYFSSFLRDSNGNIPNNIIFHGNLGNEKKHIFSKTKVGAVNPTGITETFCISVVEMASYGIPVVTKNAWAYPDVIIHGKTGLLSNSERGISRNIVKILSNDKLRENLSEGAFEFVKFNFNIELISTHWFNLLINLSMNNKINKIKPSRPYFNQYKFIKIINAFIQSRIGIPTISFIEFERRLKDTVYKEDNPFTRFILMTYKTFFKK
jgi:glycosyltransferase involved in cell wall biosynthesis